MEMRNATITKEDTNLENLKVEGTEIGWEDRNWNDLA